MRQLVTLFHHAFPDVTFHVEEVIAEGETVVARVFWTGTHRGTTLTSMNRYYTFDGR